MTMGRRRFIAIAAAAGALAASPARTFALAPVEWRGIALGAAASLIIHHEDRRDALALLQTSLAEIERLERIFSLYRPDSALVALNRLGRLEAPPLDLVALLGQADRVWRLSDGAFDPTVQPLWTLYADHFSHPQADPRGPPPATIEQTRAALGWPGVRFSSEAVAFTRPGMALTLNGIAQGYITDRIAELLRQAGMRHVLIDLGEIRSIGRRGDGLPWQVGVADHRVSLEDAAMATTSPDGTRFSPFCHHLFDPKSGRSVNPANTVTVVAASATQADSAATATAIAPHLMGRFEQEGAVVTMRSR